VPLVMKE